MQGNFPDPIGICHDTDQQLNQASKQKSEA